MYVILFDESQDKDIAGKNKEILIIYRGVLEKNQASIARRIL